jgi:hypothetical protein
MLNILIAHIKKAEEYRKGCKKDQKAETNSRERMDRRGKDRT